jgi:hypothetical protein
MTFAVRSTVSETVDHWIDNARKLVNSPPIFAAAILLTN